MKLKLFLIIFVFVFSGMGFLNAENVELKDAKKVAESKLIQLKKANNFSIKSINSNTSKNGEILFYVFDLNPKGYIVVTADTDLPPVIAYSFESYFGKYNSENNTLLKLLKTDIQFRKKNISELPVEVINQRNSLWKTILNTENSTSDNSVLLLKNSYASIGPLLETIWSQNYPFNIFFPEVSCMNIVSCPVVAMAQIVNYHATINNTSFDDSDDYHVDIFGCNFWIDDDYLEYGFPSFPELNLYLDTLTMQYENQQPLTNNDIAALCFGCAVAAKQGNTDEWGLDKVYPAYLKFGFDQAQLIYGYNSSYIIQNIMDSMPVHIAFQTPEGGYSIVVDGYEGDEFFHLNFGWSGFCNGWYSLPNGSLGITFFEGIIKDIKSTFTDIKNDLELFSEMNLSIYPNPFNKKTTISIELKENTTLQLAIYNINGILEKMLVNKMMIKGSKKFTWDGSNNSGILLTPGIYFCKLQTSKTTEIKKIIIY